jgi:CheY-like chemotaxis protein
MEALDWDSALFDTSAVSGGPGTGSAFEARLPIRVIDAPAVETPLPATEAPSLCGVSVLLVDDDPNALDFARSTLEQCGAVVVTASTAREARDRFRREPTDVIVSDLMMPGEDGLQLIRQIRELDDDHGGRTPAAALTALTRTEDRKRALSAGYQMHVAKPIDPSELVSTVERLADSRHGIGLAER